MTNSPADRKIRLLGVPLDLGAGRRGVDMGPSALRVAGLEAKLEALGYEVEDAGDLDVTIPETQPFGQERLRFAEPILETSQVLARQVHTALAEGRMPIILGGDHSIAIGSIAGSAGWFGARGQRLGVIWLDAHGDINTPETTPSGNIHGMGLAICVGLGDARFMKIGGLAGAALDGRHVAVVGARDLDTGERENFRRSNVMVFTMRDLDELGTREVMRRAIEIAARGTAGIHVQLDMDVVDPEDAPGTGTPVRGGMTYREAHLAMEMLADTGAIRAMDIVEVNPVLDERNRTAELAVELLLSALGKRIL